MLPFSLAYGWVSNRFPSLPRKQDEALAFLYPSLRPLAHRARPQKPTGLHGLCCPPSLDRPDQNLVFTTLCFCPPIAFFQRLTSQVQIPLWTSTAGSAAPHIPKVWLFLFIPDSVQYRSSFSHEQSLYILLPD